MEVDIKYTFSNMEPTDAIKEYFSTKFDRLRHPSLKLEYIDVVFVGNIHNKGVNNDFTITVLAKVPGYKIRVEVSSDDLYKAIDEAHDLFKRRLKRFHDKYSTEIENVSILMEDQLNESVEEDFVYYEPKVSYKRKMSEMRPLEVAEAIEYMELMGYNQFLFINKDNGFYSMIYKDNGKIVLVEPEDHGLNV